MQNYLHALRCVQTLRLSVTCSQHCLDSTQCWCRKEAVERAARLQQELQETKAEVKQLKADIEEAIQAR